MGARRISLVACCGLWLCQSALAAAPATSPPDDNLIGLTSPNGKIVAEFIELWWNQKKGEEAWNKYVSRDYLNHAVYSARKGQAKTFEEEKRLETDIANKSNARFVIKQLVTQGSLVFAHVHGQRAEGPGSQLVIIFRVRDGKITDHWDIHEPLKDDSMVFEQLNR
jgi:predicted SnoaL-like aldol condensation-catalyzing enzyme